MTLTSNDHDFRTHTAHRDHTPQRRRTSTASTATASPSRGRRLGDLAPGEIPRGLPHLRYGRGQVCANRGGELRADVL